MSGGCLVLPQASRRIDAHEPQFFQVSCHVKSVSSVNQIAIVTSISCSRVLVQFLCLVAYLWVRGNLIWDLSATSLLMSVYCIFTDGLLVNFSQV